MPSFPTRRSSDLCYLTPCVIIFPVPRGTRAPILIAAPPTMRALPTSFLARVVDGGDASTPEVCAIVLHDTHRPESIHEPNLRKRGEPMQIKKLTPNLVVRNVEASLKFYREILGLETAITVPEQSPFVFASVSNGSVEIFLNNQNTVAAESPRLAATIGGSLTLYMEVDSLQAILDRVQKAGARISMPVTDQFYGMKEFAFEDQDGYTITIAQKMG